MPCRVSRVREGCKESAEEEDEENEENDGEVEVEHPRGRLGHPSSEYILTQKNGVHKRRLRLRFGGMKWCGTGFMVFSSPARGTTHLGGRDGH